MSEARIGKLEDFAIETRDRLARIETRLDTLATRSDLVEQIAAVRSDLGGQIAEVRGDLAGELNTLRTDLTGEIAGLRTETIGGIAGLRTETTGGIAGLRAEMYTQFAAQTRWMIANSLGTVGILLAALKFWH